MNKCIYKKCRLYKVCKKKKNPFAGNKLCIGYEEYVRQDSILSKGTQFEIPFSSIGLEIQYIGAEMSNVVFQSNKTLKELIIQMYFFDKIKVREIHEQLDCSLQYIYEVVSKCKDKLLESQRKIIVNK
jgi:hypothetical protein